MAEANQFLIVPTVEEEGRSGEIRRRPKYVDREGVVGYSGNLFTFDDPKYEGTWIDGRTIYLVRMYGTQAALDGIAAESDALTRDDAFDAIELLNEAFGWDLDPAAWKQRFQIDD